MTLPSVNASGMRIMPVRVDRVRAAGPSCSCRAGSSRRPVAHRGEARLSAAVRSRPCRRTPEQPQQDLGRALRRARIGRVACALGLARIAVRQARGSARSRGGRDRAPAVPTASEQTLVPPADSPKMVTSSGVARRTPPRCRAPLERAHEIEHREVARALGRGRSTLSATRGGSSRTVRGGTARRRPSRSGAPRVAAVEERRPANGVAAAVDPHHHGQARLALRHGSSAKRGVQTSSVRQSSWPGRCPASARSRRRSGSRTACTQHRA